MFADNMDVTEMYAHHLKMHKGCNVSVLFLFVFLVGISQADWAGLDKVLKGEKLE